ncbi:MAG: trp operon repressor [Chitinispirillales bacterium]|jgi:TrpR family trp operon transcriptional repressor|nr:trp operon repressor [Chitinispirillales bacterium]
MTPKTLVQVLCKIDDEQKMQSFLREILTEAEYRDILGRWELMLRLKNGQTHRKIAADLQMSLCKITRGNRILKNESSVTNNLLEGEKCPKKVKL